MRGVETSPLSILATSTMFSIKKAPIRLSEVPASWIFEHYLKLNIKLSGQSYAIRSVFNPRDSNPSLNIYISSQTKDYKFKCFSTGYHGDGINLVRRLFGLSHVDAMNMVISDYREHIINNGITETTSEYSKWQVGDYTIRQWNKLDVDYWSPYNIGSELLKRYNVKALSSFTMVKEGDSSFQKTGQMIYGYFTASNQLYKIYQPLNTEKKFMNLLPNYLQGWDQLEGKSRLFICSSLKDIMALKSIGIQGDAIAPQSESAGLDSLIHWVNTYPEKYTIFDNDSTGIAMMEKYHLSYGLPYLHITLSKDISDSIRDHGAKKVKALVKSLLP